MERINDWIGGKRDSGASVGIARVYEPATGQQIASIALASSVDVSQAVAIAKAAFVPFAMPNMR